MKRFLILITIFLSIFLSSCKQQDELMLIAGSTLESSGFLDYIIPMFEEEYDIDVSVITMGSGAALELGAAGNADVLLIHDKASEIIFVEEGYGEKRNDVMYNDFIFVGSCNDTFTNIVDMLDYIYTNEVSFYSRGDLSGTNVKEIGLWESNGYDTSTFGDWYNETGQGMSATLLMTGLQQGCTLSDRASFLMMENQVEGLNILFEDPALLINQYGVVKISEDLHNRNAEQADLFYDWIISPEIQTIIGEFKINDSDVFTPNGGE